jgi:hypothetical protein
LKRFFLASLFFVSAVASASVDPFDAHVADITILQFKPLQAQIKLTESQRAAMNRIADQQRAAIAKYRESQQAAGIRPKPGPDKTVLAALAKMKQGILAVLTPAQLRRTREVTLQKISLPALADKVVADRIGMTSTQLSKFRKTLESGASQVSAIQRAAFAPIFKKYQASSAQSEADKRKAQKQGQKEMQATEARILPAMQKIKLDITAQLQGILTPAQRASWAALQGTPFKSR